MASGSAARAAPYCGSASISRDLVLTKAILRLIVLEASGSGLRIPQHAQRTVCSRIVSLLTRLPFVRCSKSAPKDSGLGIRGSKGQNGMQAVLRNFRIVQ
jgi:hypothetical protein